MIPLSALVIAVGLGTFELASPASVIEQPTLNQGGHPADGVVMNSANHRISLDSIGDGVTAASMTSASLTLDRRQRELAEALGFEAGP